MKRSTKLFGAAAIGVLAALVLWYPVVEPALVRFPKSTTVVTHYTGTLTTYMDNATGGALATPTVIPVAIDRTVRSVPGQTGADKAVVRETNVIHAAGQAQWQSHVYVLDRRSMQNVKDARSTAFGEPIDRSGSYYLNLPMGTNHAKTYTIAKVETGGTYVMHAAEGAATTTVDGVRVLRMTASQAPTPIGPEYTKAMVPFMGFPTSLTFDQVQAQLQAAGVDTSRLMVSLGKTLTPPELTSLAAIMQKPVPLRYSAFLDHGDGLIEPDTGMIVGLPSVSEGISVAPDLSVWAPALEILNRYSAAPEIQSAMQTMTTVASAPPQPVYRLQYQETAASMKSSAGRAATERSKLRLAHYYLPASLLVLTWVLGGLAVYTWRRPRPTEPAEVIPLPERTPSAARAA